MWVRNGLQIKGQAMTYVQCHFCYSMLDADIYLMQVIMINLDGDVKHLNDNTKKKKVKFESCKIEVLYSCY